MDSFGQDHVLDSSADDLKDHWTNDDHEGERRRLVETLRTARDKAPARDHRVGRRAWRPGAWSITGRGAGRQLGADPAADLDRAVVHPAGVRHGAAVLPRAQQRGRFAQTLDVNLSAEMMLFPELEPLRDGGPQLAGAGTGRRRGQAVGELALRDRESFTNHLLATDPVRVRAGQRGGPVASRDFRRPVVGAASPAVALVALGNVAGGRGGDHRAKAAGGKGAAEQIACIASQPSSCSIWRCASVSTPSASVRMPSE